MSNIEHTVAHAYRRGYTDAMNAARAWQALRDWLNGTPEEWQRQMVIHGRASFAEGATINPLMAEMYQRIGGQQR